MAVEAFERALRRLSEHHRHLGRAVGCRMGGARIVLFRAYDDERGQLQVLRVQSDAGVLNLFDTRRIASAALGKAWCGGVEHVDLANRSVWYVVLLDVQYRAARGPLKLVEPAAIRWYDGRQLAAGIGQQDSGHLTIRGIRLIPENG